MALPTPVKTWQFLNNQTVNAGSIPNNNKAWLLQWKNALIGFASSPWTTRYSCNGTTAGAAGDGVDRWATVADVVLATAGTAHSWYVLKQAGLLTNAQILISASPEGGGTYAATQGALGLFFSPSAGFTGGTTTARPTATDEIAMTQVGASLTGSPGGSGFSAGVIRTHYQQSTDGACTRMVMAASNVACMIVIFDQVSNSVTGWTNPYFIGIGHSGITTAFPAASGTQIASWTSLTPANQSRQIKIGATLGVAMLTAEGNGSALAPADTNYGNLANEVDGLWPIYPIGIATPTVGIRGRQGSMIDMWWGSSAVASGDTYDLTSKTFAQFGNFILPWDGVTIPALT